MHLHKGVCETLPEGAWDGVNKNELSPKTTWAIMPMRRQPVQQRTDDKMTFRFNGERSEKKPE